MLYVEKISIKIGKAVLDIRFLNNCKLQRQPSTGVLRKKCSEIMQQIYRRMPMLKRDFFKDAKQFYRNHTSAWVLSCKFAAYFQNMFSLEHLWTTASEII